MTENQQKQQGTQRTSLYLVRRADALIGALRFFAAEDRFDATQRRLQFLAQSDYWEWEVENLIYSFTNLAERRATWRSPDAAARKLTQLGIVVNAKLFRHSRWVPAARSHVRDGHWSNRQKSQPIAPVEMLRQVIDLWNQVVSAVEAQFIAPIRGDVERWGVNARPDLASLRKQMPQLEEMTDE